MLWTGDIPVKKQIEFLPTLLLPAFLPGFSSFLIYLLQFWHQFQYVCIFFPTPSNSHTPSKCYNSTQFWHSLLGTFHRLKVQSYGLPPFQMSITNPGCYLCFWLTSWQSEISIPSSPSLLPLALGLINLLGGLRNPVYSLDCWFIPKYIKDTNEQPEEISQGKVLNEGVFVALEFKAPTQLRLEAFWFHQTGSPLNPVLLDFHGCFVTLNDWLNHQPVMTELHLRLLPIPQMLQGWD